MKFDYRIGLVIDSLAVGGSQREFVNLALELAAEGISVHVYALRDFPGFEHQLHAADIPVTAFQKRGRLDLAVVRELARCLRQDRIDLIHCFKFTANTAGRLATLLYRIPVVTYEGTILVHPRFSWRHLVDSVLLPLSDMIVVNAEAARHNQMQRFGLSPERVVVIRNGMDTDMFTPGPPDLDRLPEEFAKSDGRLYVGTVAIPRPVKDHHLIIRAAAALQERFPHARYVLVGAPFPWHDPRYHQSTRDLADQLGVADIVHFVPTVSDVANFLRLMDVFVLPSRREAASNALLEAMATGKPTVVTDVGDSGLIARSSQSGLSVPAGDLEAFVEALAILMSDGALRERMGRRGRAWVVEECSLERHRDKAIDLYTRVLRP